MKLLELMKGRRSIRKYQARQIPRTALEQVLERPVERRVLYFLDAGKTVDV